METTTFDGIARNFGSTLTRRSALRNLFAGAASVVAGGAILQAEDASAKRRKKNRKKKNGNQGLGEGARCSSDGQCRSSQHLICEIPYGAGNSDKACCRGAGATCGPDLHCCTGEAGGREFECVNGTCQPYVEE